MTDSLWDKILSWQLPFGVIVIILVIAFCIFNAENLVLLQGKIWGLFRHVSNSATKKQIALTIRGSVIKASKKIAAPDDILPKDLKIIWSEQDDRESFFSDNCVVLYLKQEVNPDLNFVNVVTRFVSTGLLYGKRRYIDQSILRACDLLLSEKIVSVSRPSAMDCFYDEIYKRETTEYPSIQSDYSSLKNIDSNGMFAHLYINELYKASAQEVGAVPDPCLKAETGELLHFLERMALKVSGDPEDLNFNREYFKIGILLAISDRTMNNKGLEAHSKVISHLLDDGIETIYIFGLGTKVGIALQLARETKKTDYRILRTITHEYKHYSQSEKSGKRTKGVCIQLTTY